jgi:hypothetical protein
VHVRTSDTCRRRKKGQETCFENGTHFTIWIGASALLIAAPTPVVEVDDRSRVQGRGSNEVYQTSTRPQRLPATEERSIVDQYPIMFATNTERRIQAGLKVYADLKGRCENPKHKGYKNHGARGVKFLFESFDQFMDEEVGPGPRPPGKAPSGRALYSPHRIDRDGHFEPGNVKWAKKRQVTSGAWCAPRRVSDEELPTAHSPRDEIRGYYVLLDLVRFLLSFRVERCWIAGVERFRVAIPLYSRLPDRPTVAYVSPEDAPKVLLHRWNPNASPKKDDRGRTFYVRGHVGGKEVQLHNFILDVPSASAIEVDHIDLNPLNCTRWNMRLVTRSANLQNQKVRNKTTGFKGVYRTGERYHAAIRGKRLGTFRRAEEAAMAYDYAARQLYPGMVVRVNFPRGDELPARDVRTMAHAVLARFGLAGVERASEFARAVCT